MVRAEQCHLVVVGDVTADEVRGLAERFFGGIERREVPTAKRPLELDEPGERRLQAAREDAVADIADGVQRPQSRDRGERPPVHALRLISALLDGGYSARLPERLERGEELVTSASARYDAYARGDSLFVLSAAPNMQKGRTTEEVESGLWRELDALKEAPPSADELERVRARVIAGLVYERDSITQQATTIGKLETVGLSRRLMDEELAALEAVTPEDIQQAARSYFTRSRLSVAHVLPEEARDE